MKRIIRYALGMNLTSAGLLWCKIGLVPPRTLEKVQCDCFRDVTAWLWLMRETASPTNTSSEDFLYIYHKQKTAKQFGHIICASWTYTINSNNNAAWDFNPVHTAIKEKHKTKPYKTYCKHFHMRNSFKKPLVSPRDAGRDTNIFWQTELQNLRLMLPPYKAPHFRLVVF